MSASTLCPCPVSPAGPKADAPRQDLRQVGFSVLVWGSSPEGGCLLHTAGARMLGSHWYLQSLPGRPAFAPGMGGPGLIGTGSRVISEVVAVVTSVPLIFPACPCSSYPWPGLCHEPGHPPAFCLLTPPSRPSTSGPEARLPLRAATDFE